MQVETVKLVTRPKVARPSDITVRRVFVSLFGSIELEVNVTVRGGLCSDTRFRR